ncbi:MAG: hypothetical protein KDB82_11290 [Planctomycetes bacterium]|nr:hypothetical protein [Planctomycetota bacterium]
MWIKRSLVLLPILVLVFLIQSIFWVPSTSAVSDNESRLDRLMLYMGANPEDMDSWTSTKTSDSTISDYLYEGLIKINKDYEMQPGLADSVLVKHQIDARVPDDMTVEQFKSELAGMFGGKLKDVKVLKEAEPTARFDITTGEMLAKDAQPAEGQLVLPIHQSAKVRVLLVPEPKQNEITSAIEPDFEELLEKRLGRKPWGSMDAKLLLERAKALVPEDRVKELTDEVLSKNIEEALVHVDVSTTSHAPILEFHMRKGVYWTDGPFFDDKAHVWKGTCNGEPCGWVTADSEQDALAKLRAKGLVENPDQAEYTASTYAETFGSEEGGYWWGKGPELTSRDVKLTFEYLKDPRFNSPRRSSYLSIEEVRTYDDDPYKLDVVYGELYSPALGDLAGDILPYHVWNTMAWKEEAIRRGKGPEDVGQTHAVYDPMLQLPSREREFGRRPSTLGYMVIEPLNGDTLPLWENGKRCRLRRNEFYWDRKPEYQFIDYYIFDPNLGRETAEVVFNTGGLDIYSPRDFQVKRYEEQTEKYTVIKRQPNQYEYLGFNCSKPQLADKRVRMALSMAIDVEQILKYVVYDQGTRINGPGYPVLPWYDQDFMIEHTWLTDTKDADGNVVHRKGKTEKIKYLPYDPDEAKAILLQAGYEDVNGKLVKDGKPLRLEFINSTGGGARKNTALLAKDNWQKLGVDVDYREYEWNVFIQQYIMALKFDVCMLGWSGGIDFDMRQLWKSDQWPTAGGLNLAAYSNPEADKLMEEIIKVYDYDTQVKMSHKIFDLIAQDFPYVFLYSPLSTTVMDNRIIWRKKVGVGPDGEPLLEDRPVNNDYVKNARANLKYFLGQLKRVEEAPEWKPEDYKR